MKMSLIFLSFVFGFVGLRGMEAGSLSDGSAAAAAAGSSEQCCYDGLPTELDVGVMEHVPLEVELLKRCGEDVAEWRCPDYPRAVAWSPGGKYVAIGDLAGEVSFWTLDGKKRGSYRQPGSVHSIAWSPDGMRIATVCCHNGANVLRINSNNSVGGRNVARVCPDGTEFVCWLPDSRGVMPVSRLGGEAPIFTLEGKEIGKFDLVRRSAYEIVRAAHLSSCGRFLMCANRDGKIQTCSSSREELPSQKVCDGIELASFSPDGTYLACGSYALGCPTSEIEVFRTYDGKKMLGSELNGGVTKVSWSPNGLYIALVQGKSVLIKNVTGLLLADRAPKVQTLRQYLLLRKLADSRVPVIIGWSDREALEGVPGVKKLLTVERSQSQTENPIWRLTMRGLHSGVEHVNAKLENRRAKSLCCVM